jgi:ribonuclease D
MANTKIKQQKIEVPIPSGIARRMKAFKHQVKQMAKEKKIRPRVRAKGLFDRRVATDKEINTDIQIGWTKKLLGVLGKMIGNKNV